MSQRHDQEKMNGCIIIGKDCIFWLAFF